jgi:SAM-dependent methyltransferase
VELWNGRETAEIHRCAACSFEFANPFASGDERFYNLISDLDPRHPARRWEFERTIEALTERGNARGGRLLEVGAGSGWFLKRLRSSPVADNYAPLALEYDRGALRQLQEAGFETSSASLQELGRITGEDERFAVICIFQTLHHLSDVQGTFGALARLLRSSGDIFISVPFARATEIQERLTGYWDLPPNHVARWTSSAFEAITQRHSLRVVAVEPEQTSRLAIAWRLALYATLARAYDERSLAGRVNALRRRSLRGPAKRLLAATYLPRMLAAWPELVPREHWIHIRRDDERRASA